MVNPLLIVKCMSFSGFLYCKCTRFCVAIPFITVNVWGFYLFVFVPISISKFTSFGIAVLLLVSLKRNSTRIARVVFPFSLFSIYGTNDL